MAQELGLTYATIQTHFKRIRKIFCVHKTVELLQVVRPREGNINNVVLTARGLELFLMLEQGHTTEDIACHLHISVSGVRRRKEKILSDNECRTLYELLSKYYGVNPPAL